ncbi:MULTISPECIES: DNA polymerase III subunit delta [unclassified Amycolatopsis]|uniref:DNA polymerase III subunit delta n=1 Tax=unclassified Amycolatopsis TaxID=2618356 RepID=UPI002874B0CD|nr:MULTISPECIES: DNA polymerase III subunit delta [unclassified Amycolatopsis]MDS0136401.1 DNA polymerase III subunit delta [Amycolatopsis sp. 505]MDS0145916.1 DNA polymerase III subunit delta [Amycolatopsis sp. CM201R]
MTAQATAPTPLQLVLGEEELLIERAVRETLAAARATDPTAELTRVRVSDLTAPELAELVSPSLFSEGRVIVLESAQDISQELADAVASYLKDPADGVVLVVVHTGGGRSKAGKSLPAALKKAGAEVTECPKLTKPAEREQFVRHEVRRVGGKIDPAGVAALLDAVGSDLRELSSAATQLVADTGGTVDADAVRRYHRGRADVTGFAVAEKAVSGDRSAALESLRWAMQLGVPHVLVADALADAVRTIARVSGAGRGNPNQLAGELGMPPWKIRKAQGQSRGWNPDGLATAMRVVARLNAEVKGAAADPGYALERAVLEVAAAKG